MLKAVGVVGFLDATAALMVLAALFGFFNHKVLKLPFTIGLVVSALFASLTLLLIDAVMPSLGWGARFAGLIGQVDFAQAILNGMLSVLLFAGALHVELADLRERLTPILTLATLGTLISAGLVGVGSYLVFGAVGLAMPLLFCFVFGALISPTDPIAVLGIMKAAGAPKDLEVKVIGESLFNDGLAVVLFVVLLEVALASTGQGAAVGVGDVLGLVALEVGGGVALGLGLGYVGYRALCAIDEPNLEILISVALILGLNAVALQLHASAPLGAVFAGLLIGNQGRAMAMSPRTRETLDVVWAFIDEALNAVLFLLVGLEVMAIPFEANALIGALLLIPLTLAARWVGVVVPIQTLRWRKPFARGTVRVLTWGGLKGGVSVALAMSLPPFEGRGAVLVGTYAVVIFSIIVQGLTVGPLIARVTGDARRGQGARPGA